MIFSTDSIPVAGGLTGALSQINKFIPTWGAVISMIILTILGTTVGYLLKLLLDALFRKSK